MNNIKKRLLFSSLILTSLIVLSFYALGDLLGTTSVASSGAVVSIDNSSSFGTEPKTVNVSIGYGGDGVTNITAFNLTIGPTGNHSFGFVALDGDDFENLHDENFTLNVTFWPGSGLTDSAWACHNDSVVTISCNTTSEVTGIENNVNTSLVVMFNLTGATDIEDTILWNLLVWNGTYDGEASSSAANGTNLTVYVDTLAPRLIGINVSDGNMTLGNYSHVNLSDWEGAFNRENLLDLTDLTVTAGIEESDINEIWLYYQANDSGNASVAGEYTYKVKMSDNGNNLFTATIASSYLTDQNVSTFVIVANDSNGNIVFLNNTDEGDSVPFSFFVNSTDTIKIGQVSVNDSYSTNHSLSGLGLTGGDDYLRAEEVTISAEITGGGKGANSVFIVWNNTGTITYYGALGQFNANTFDEYVVMTNTSAVNETTVLTIANFVAAIPLTGNDSNNFEFYIVANSTDNNYTAVSGPYNFIVDGITPSSPTVTLTSPSGATSIETSGSATYSCSSSDSGVGGVTYSWKLTKPDGTTVTSHTGSSTTFSDSEVNQAGTYTVQCTASDALGYTSSSSVSLGVVYGSGGGTGGTGGSGGSSTGPSFDVDLSTQDSGTISAKQGYVKTFSFDGNTKHIISFKTVETDKATLKISSVPVEITLGIKESREVDINGDGMNDMRVTLNEIRGGKAEITIKRLEAGAEVVAREDRKAAGIEEDTGVEEVEEIIPEEGMGLSNLVMIIAIILIIAGVGYYFMRKK